MKMIVEVSIGPNIFAMREAEVSDIQSGLKKVMKLLESMPDEADGMQSYDWTETSILFRNS